VVLRALGHSRFCAYIEWTDWTHWTIIPAAPLTSDRHVRKNERVMSRRLRIIEGSPGAGRSESILHEIAARIGSAETSADSVLVLTPRSADSRLLAARFDRLILDTGRWHLVRFDTLQGVARDILARDPEFAYHRPMDDTEERLVLETVIHQVFSDPEESGESSVYRQAVTLRSSGFIDDVHAFVAELKQHRIAPIEGHPGSSTTYAEFTSSLPQQDALRTLGKVYETYQQILRNDQRYDAQGVLWNAYVAAHNERFLERFPHYRLVYYDDAQDISALEAELLMRILHPDTELVLTHCPPTAAFRFRYALRDPVSSIASLVASRDGDPPKVITEDLDSGASPVTARRPISSIAIEINGENRGKLPTDLWACRDVRSEREAVAAEVVRLLEEGTRRPEEIAIITRTRAEAQEFSALLTELNVPVDDATDGIGTALILLDHFLRFLEGGLELLRTGEPAKPNSALERSLLDLASLGPDGAETACRIMEIAESLREEGTPLVQPNDDRTGLAFASKTSISWEHFESLNDALRQCREGTPTSQVLAHLWAAFSVHHALAEPRRSSVMRVFGRVLQRIADVEQTVEALGGRIGPSAVRRRLRELVGHGTQPEDRGGVAILPAHETRGRQWPMVFLPRLNEHSFPADTQISALFRDATAQELKRRAEKLDEDRGLGGGAFSFAGFAEDPQDAKQEEDRLFVLAATRASERLVLSWSDSDGERDIAPSVYAREAVGRRLEIDPHDIDWATMTDRFRQAPARDSYWYPQTREPAGEIISPGAVPVFHSVKIEHSPSSLSTYWLCPRRFFYRHVLRLEEEIADNQVYGMMVHAVLRNLLLEPMETADVNTMLAREDIQQIISRHRAHFSNETSFSFFLDRLVSSLYDLLDKDNKFFNKDLYWMGTGPVVEKKLTRIENIGEKEIAVIGTIDLVFTESPDQVRIVDFKTKMPVSAKQLRRSMVFRDQDAQQVNMPNRDYQLPLYKFLLNPTEQVLLSHYYVRPSYREGFLDRTITIKDNADDTSITETELAACVEEALSIAVSIEEAVDFPREPKNDACRGYQNECPYLFLCDGIEGD